MQKVHLKKAFDAGVPIVLRTDGGFVGVPDQRRNEDRARVAIVEARLTPAEALRAATINGAHLIGDEKDFGTVEPGKLADLVILDADPLADIAMSRGSIAP